MSNRRTGLKQVAEELKRDPLRSPLFHWLSERYKALAPSVAGLRPNWRVLRDRAIRENVTDADGKPPTNRIVRLTWRKVEREIAALRSYQLTGVKPARQQASRVSVTWQPPIAQPQPPAPATKPTQTIDPDDPPPGSWEYVRRQLEKMSGR